MAGPQQAGSAFITVRPDLRGFHTQVRRELRTVNTAMRGIGREWGTQIQAGIKEKLKPIEIRLDGSRVARQVTTLNRSLDKLDGRRVSVRIDVQVAGQLAELQMLEQVLARIDHRTANIRVNADVGAALARLLAAEQRIRELNGQTAHARVDVDSGGALASISAVRLALLGLSATSALIGPQLAAVGAGVIGLAAPLTAGAAGFAGLAAVAVPAVMRIREATQQQEQASKAAGAAAGQAQSKAFAQAAAQQQLAAAVRNAAQQHRQALEQVRQAEQQVEQAQRSARQAQEDLTRARHEARRALQDMANDLASARLDERQAVFDVADAEKELAKLRANPKATQDQIARQQLAVDKAKQQLKEQRLNLQRLTVDERAASKAGVEGSDQVRAARDRLAEANRRIAEAERGLAQARANVARVDAQSADQIASARRAMAQANMQAASSTAALGGQMVKLTALEQQLATAWKGLTGAFNEWAKALQPAVLPLLIRGIGLLRSLLPSLTPIVISAARGVGILLDKLQAGLQSPFFKQFAADLAKWAGPAIVGLGTLVGNLVKGLAGLARAFAPIGFAFMDMLNRGTAAFARFTTNLTRSEGFQQFTQSAIGALEDFGSGIARVFRLFGPILADILPTLVQIGRNIRQVVNTALTGLAPLLSAVVPVVVRLVEWFTRLFTLLNPGDIQAIVVAFAAYKGVMLAIRIATMAWAAAQTALNFVLTANPIGLVIIAIGALVAAVVVAYRHSETFRSIVQTVWAGVKTAILAAWQFVQPVFAQIGRIIGVVLPVAFRALRTVVRVVWAAISTHIKAQWTVIRVVFNAIRSVINNVVAPVIRWLWTNVVKPVFNNLRSHISTVWNRGVRPVFESLRRGVNALGGYFRTGVDAIRRQWGKLRDAARKPVAFVINTVWNGGIVKMWNAVAKLVPGTKEMSRIHFARGGVVPAGAYGVLPGYAPGRDTMLAAVSPGEAWIRPDATRALGSSFIYGLNDAARRGGATGAARWLAQNGYPRFAFGGIVGKFLKSAKNMFTGGLVNTAKKAFSPMVNLAERTIGGTPFGELAMSVTRGLVGNILKAFGPLETKIGGDGRKVVKVAEKYIGVSGNPNRFTREWGLNGYPWCGMFVGSVFREAGAKKALRRVAWPPLVSSYTTLPKVSRSAARPGDVALYRGDSGHINIYTGKGAVTIGGNESNSVRRQSGYINSASSIRRPQFARGGIVGRMLPALLGQDLRENSRRTTPFATQLLRAVAGQPMLYDQGGWLPPGITTVLNATGRPEAVLTEAQLRAIAAGARGGDGSSVTYNVYPRTLDMTVRDLEALQRRQDAMARVGRPR